MSYQPGVYLLKTVSDYFVGSMDNNFDFITWVPFLIYICELCNSEKLFQSSDIDLTLLFLNRLDVTCLCTVYA